MKGFLYLRYSARAMLLAFLFSSTALAGESPLQPLESFSALPAFKNPKLSPQGDRIAYVQNLTVPEELSVLTTYDLKEGKIYSLLGSDNEKVKINWYHWANNERLVISARYESRQHSQKFYQTRLFAMTFNKPTAKPEELLDARRLQRKMGGRSFTPQFQDDVIDWLPDDPEHILIAIDIETVNLPSVYKVNIYNGKLSMVERGKRRIRDWMTDQQSQLRLGTALNYENGETEILLKDGDDWKTLFSYNALSDKPITPKGFALDPNILYFNQYKGDYLALYKLNLTTMEQTEVLSDEHYDVGGSLIYSKQTRDAIGVYFSAAENGEHYWDNRFGKLQESVDAVLPDYENSVISFSTDEMTYLLYAESDQFPGAYLIGNRQAGSLDLLYKQYPDLDPEALSENKRVSFKARDGVEIEGYLTIPKTGKAPYPTIINPHGGPGVREYSGFNYWTAYFTSRGYAVFRPNFRGSSGYGYTFAQAQMKGWGLQMQDDITDATHWLIKDGVTNPDKVCIVGASYGGYAALMATVKTPELFTCAVSFAGVSSLKKLVRTSSYFLGSEFVKNQIGEDSDDLEARSPYYLVEKIKTPILLIHGDEDRTVRVDQSRIMADELEDEDKDFRYVELEAGDHFLSIQRNRHAFFQELDTFLSKYLH
ncbi:S9 family peptidase [Alteromonas pelagimontana]|uniref:S9 family peptidase n=1 Tax=Alteromonas pelagimontana TaxID=1858656 RepID=A0A6M4ME62_9ALTE|nr:prolyl oligopeptidase family serine peptidase [Alteromonas pelagimontana]QJR80890.1 S9 family peptidase [Alteromonas pelagimontana]